jgi:hypothetical protein
LTAFLRRDPNQPFCLFVCSALPHAAYVAGDPSVFDASKLILQNHWIDTPKTREDFRLYLAKIAALDQQVGDVLQVLKESQLEDKTLTLSSGEQGSAFPGAKWSCYNAGVRSAFIARLPGKIPAGTRTDAISMCEDILPTLIEMAGGNAAEKALDGRSLLPVLTGSTTAHRDHAFGMLNMQPDGKPFASRFIVNHQHKLILNLTPKTSTPCPVARPTAASGVRGSRRRRPMSSRGNRSAASSTVPPSNCLICNKTPRSSATSPTNPSSKPSVSNSKAGYGIG